MQIQQIMQTNSGIIDNTNDKLYEYKMQCSTLA